MNDNTVRNLVVQTMQDSQLLAP